MDVIQQSIARIIRSCAAEPSVRRMCLERLQEGKLTRDENPQSHFCVFFAAYDRETRSFFLGHHIKADKWIFNGGHIDKGELPDDTVRREIGEEWGIHVPVNAIGTPGLLTIKPVEHPDRLICQYHFDIWYFIPCSKNSFHPDPKLLATEFYETGWKTMAEAYALVTDTNTRKGMMYIEQHFFS